MKPIRVESGSFQTGEWIPGKHSCEGRDVSPELSFKDVPPTAGSLVLIVDDPDASVGTFDHWLAWNIPPVTRVLEEGESLPMQGVNHFGEARYRGPCPPRGKPHRYYFRVFALDTMLDLPYGSTRKELEDAMEGHVLAQGYLIGRYQRKS